MSREKTKEVNMKGKLSRMLRSGLSLMLVLCMLISMAPAAFAVEVPDANRNNSIDYVAIGASNVNGYGMRGYINEADMIAAELDWTRKLHANIFGYRNAPEGSYPKEVANELGATVHQLALSSMRAEEVRVLLDDDYYGDSYTRWRFTGGPDKWFNVAHPRGISGLRDDYQNTIANADLITLDIGVNNFGVYMSYQLTSGHSLDNDVNLIDPSLGAEFAAAKEQVRQLLTKEAPEYLTILDSQEDLINTAAYALIGYCYNFDRIVERIYELNPDANIVVVSIQNLMDDLKMIMGSEVIPLGDAFGVLVNAANTYIATGSPYADRYLVADVRKNGHVEFFQDEIARYNGDPTTLSQNIIDCFNVYDGFGTHYDKGVHVKYQLHKFLGDSSIVQSNGTNFNGETNWEAIISKLISNETVRNYILTHYPSFDKFMDAGAKSFADDHPYASTLIGLYEEVCAYYNRMLYAAYDAVASIMQAGVLIDTLDAAMLTSDTGDIEDVLGEALSAQMVAAVEGAMGSADYDYVLPENFFEAIATKAGVSEAMVKGVLTMAVRTSIGNSFFGHPNANGHAEIKAAVLNTLENSTTGKDVIEEEVKLALNELYKLMETYGPEVAAQVWAQWEEYGYVDMVDASIDELKEMLDARYTYYTETALPAINDSITVMTEQKDALAAELDALKMELAIKKGELEQVIAEQEIGSIHTPDINIDVELGDNEQTIVPDHECVVDGDTIEAELEAAIADLEHAIAVIEALISDIEADIEDMIALAEQIAEAVAELEKTMSDIAEAGEDLANAIEEVAAVLQNNEGVVDAVIASYNAARTTALAAAEVLELTMGTANEMVADIDTMIAKIAEDAEALYNKFVTELPGCIEQIPEEAMIMAAPIALIQQELEANKEEIKAKLAEEIAALAAQYGINEESINAELAAINAKIKAEVDAQYAAVEAEIQAQIDALNAEANAKLAALQAELDALNAQLAAAADEDKAAIQAQIDRVTGDMTTVSEDLACAISHLEEAAQIAYDEIVAEVTAAYDAAIAELNKQLADLKAAYDKAVEELTAAADKAIADLIAKAEEQIAELGKLGEELNKALNGIYDAIHNELADAQAAIEAILKGQLDAVEDLADALAELGLDTLNEIVNGLVEQVNALLEEATTADMIIDDDFMYVAIGDGSAAAEGYAEKLRDALNAEAAENGVNAIDFANYAKAGNTVAAERKNLSDVADADLITVGFSNVTFLDKAVESAMNGAELDWALVVGEENVPYVEQLLADVAAEIAAAGIEGEYADLINAVIEAYAYSAVQYAVELPGLIQDIREVNPDAVVIIVGNYNPVDGVSFVVDNVSIDIGEYVDYLVDGIAVHGVAYAILTGDAIYVDARDVETQNTKTELSITALMQMAYNKFSALYPNAAGDDSIAAEIADALNITYVKAEPTGMKGDVNLDGKVTAADIAVLRNYLLERTELSDQALYNAEVSYDGNVTAADIAVIRNYLLERIDTL